MTHFLPPFLALIGAHSLPAKPNVLFILIDALKEAGALIPKPL
jgi:hypothetical protein